MPKNRSDQPEFPSQVAARLMRLVIDSKEPDLLTKGDPVENMFLKMRHPQKTPQDSTQTPQDNSSKVFICFLRRNSKAISQSYQNVLSFIYKGYGGTEKLNLAEYNDRIIATSFIRKNGTPLLREVADTLGEIIDQCEDFDEQIDSYLLASDPNRPSMIWNYPKFQKSNTQLFLKAIELKDPSSRHPLKQFLMNVTKKVFEDCEEQMLEFAFFLKSPLEKLFFNEKTEKGSEIIISKLQNICSFIHQGCGGKGEIDFSDQRDISAAQKTIRASSPQLAKFFTKLNTHIRNLTRLTTSFASIRSYAENCMNANLKQISTSYGPTPIHVTINIKLDPLQSQQLESVISKAQYSLRIIGKDTANFITQAHTAQEQEQFDRAQAPSTCIPDASYPKPDPETLPTWGPHPGHHH